MSREKPLHDQLRRQPERKRRTDDPPCPIHGTPCQPGYDHEPASEPFERVAEAEVEP
jgi:hypothetical protein